LGQEFLEFLSVAPAELEGGHELTRETIPVVY
jgi:hypothetical protein